MKLGRLSLPVSDAVRLLDFVKSPAFETGEGVFTCRFPDISSQYLVVAKGTTDGFMMFRTAVLTPRQVIDRLSGESQLPGALEIYTLCSYNRHSRHKATTAGGTYVNPLYHISAEWCITPEIDGPYAPEVRLVDLDFWDGLFPKSRHHMELQLWTNDPKLYLSLDATPPDELARRFMVASVTVVTRKVGRPSKTDPRLWVRVVPAILPPRCERCGSLDKTIGTIPDYPTYCRTCTLMTVGLR